MKKIFLILIFFLAAGQMHAQQIYQIRADSVRIYNDVGTAELIVENRTRDTLGFLFNKGHGRTEFHKLNLQSLSGGRIALIGHDTVAINVTPVKNVDSLWQKGDSVAYRIDSRNYAVFAPLTFSKLNDVRYFAIKNEDLLRYNLSLNKWENWAFADTLLGRDLPFNLGISRIKTAYFSNVPYDSIGQNSVALGFSAMAKSSSAIAIGYLARSAIGNSIAIGSMSNNALNGYSVAIGPSVYLTANNSIAIGALAKVTVSNSIALGYSSNAIVPSSMQIAIGAFSAAKGVYSTALGFQAVTAGGTSIGYRADAYGTSVAIGADSRTANLNAIAIGPPGAYAKTVQSMGLFDAEDGQGRDSANVVRGFFARFKGGYELYTDSSFTMKQVTGDKGAVFFSSNPHSTFLGLPVSSQASTLNVNGSLSLPLTKVSSNYAITSNDYTVIALNSVTLTLPGDVGANPRLYELQNASASSLTVATSLSQKIKNLDTDTTTSYALASGARITVQFDGTDWWIIQ
ncbi:hypothetical protein [Chitinophaga niabensis]|uniref:Trimeric autotransporter adhesin YadA-like head domain-containing protein n=1 Tax=Chitinophaga niabensis TaxID=536979 RepID=A0A1N6DJK7_9BACT|nr:hypothetical protein [Chitinophaga niabensis]SIN71019.1 hypothetical protein SAMN04488055_0824 [Chitinophaga niabensis]